MGDDSVATTQRLRLRRTWPQRALIVGGMGLTVVSLGAAWGLVDAYNSVGDISRFEVADGVLTDPESDEPGVARNILLIGSTENAGLDPGASILEGRDDVALADTMMVLRVDPAAHRAMLLTINRDIVVPQGPWGYEGMINGAYDGRDPSLLITVIRDYIGIEINNFVKVNFAGFEDVIDEMDGVPVFFEHPLRDEGSFFAADAGCQVLDGEMALSYVRSRKMEVDRDGDGSYENADAHSDLDRTTRQRDFLVLTAHRAIERGARDPRVLRSMIGAVSDNGAVQLDTKLSPDDLIDISQAFDDFSPESLQSYGVATAPDPRDPNRLVLDEAGTAPLVDLFRGGDGTTSNDSVRPDVEEARAPEQRAGDAATPADELRALGFGVTPRRAKAEDRTDRTTIVYSSDEALAALTLARNLATHPAFTPVAGRGVLTLRVGSDWTGVTLTPLPPEAFAGELPSAPPVTDVTATTTRGAATSSVAPTTTAAVATTSAPTSAAVIGADPVGGLCDPG